MTWQNTRKAENIRKDIFSLKSAKNKNIQPLSEKQYSYKKRSVLKNSGKNDGGLAHQMLLVQLSNDPASSSIPAVNFYAIF